MKALRVGILPAAHVAAISCGIPQDRDPDVVPGGAIGPALGPTPTAAATAPAGEGLTVFFVRTGQLVPAGRTAARADVHAALQSLLNGPGEQELAAGLRTAITGPADVRLVRIEGATAHVDLAAPFVAIGGQEQILALAQVVLTATSVTGITDVRFTLEGQPVDVPRGDGTLSSGPLTTLDYASLRDR
jgi:spore germination protein GerM